MALQIWLPLIDDTHNQGIANDFQVSNHNATIESNGKLGSCYNFNGTDSYLDCSGWFPNELSELTIAFWAYRISGNYCLFRGDAHRINLTSVGVTYRDSSHSNQTEVAYTTAIPEETWVHLAVVYNKGSWQLYTNGQPNGQLDVSTVSQLYADIDEFRIGRQQSSSGSKYFSGRINDFRIYDNALSAKEIQEIAKALIQHYPLDELTMEPTHNYFSAAQSRADITSYTITHASSTSAYISIGNITIDGCGKYTASVYVENTSDASIRIGMRCYRVTSAWSDMTYGNYIAPGESGWSSVTVDYSDDTYYSGTLINVRYSFNTARQNITSNPSLGHTQLERNDHRTEWILGGTSRAGDICHDTSGYCHDGSIVGTIMLDDETPRYTKCAIFDGASAIKAGRGSMVTDAITYSCWGLMTGDNGRIYSSLQSGGAGIEIANKVFSSQLHVNGAYKTVGTKYTLSDELWHHYCVTYDGAIHKFYVDGTLIGSTNATGPLTYNKTNELIIGAEANATSYQAPYFIGKMSDFRVYATALNAEQVLELYNISMSIDASGNISARILTT